MIIGVVKETLSYENRIPLLPETAEKYKKLGLQVYVENGMGNSIHIEDAAYIKAGAEIKSRAEVLQQSDIVAGIRKPADDKILHMKAGSLHISFLDAFNEKDLLNRLAEKKINSISMEFVPRITRAQKMDALSSQTNIGGYYAVMLAASHLSKVLPMMMTAAGTISPARVFIIGVGVAGLQAIATAKRLGARVEAFDTRAVVEEQVQSLGAKFVKIDIGETGQTKDGYARELTPEQLEKQREGMKKILSQSDIVVTTAQVFGKKAPVLLTADMVQAMRPGSIVVDMAVETGGNVEGSKLNQTVNINGVTIIGEANLPGRAAVNSSQLMSEGILVSAAYIIASVLFIVGLKKLGSPESAKTGNALSALGMFIAVAVTLFDQHILTYEWILLGVVIGSAVGVALAYMTPMTSMPQMVALLNGFGGAASVLVAAAEVVLNGTENSGIGYNTAVYLTILIGAVTFTGSVIAFLKLGEYISGKPMVFVGQNIINSVIVAALLLLGVLYVFEVLPEQTANILIAITAVSLILGVLSVIPIGGADMPVVIALLNSYSGLAGAAAGFILLNSVLIVSGSLVGASGIILTNIMCKSMNRSIFNVLFSGFGSVKSSGKTEKFTGEVKPISVSDAYLILEAASSVVIVPGYGMAVSQAQHAVRELADKLEKNGADVKYAIHPVAGRMPGHMNVLLAEANISYDMLFEPDLVNPTMETVDVCIVIGANDVVNPAAKSVPSSPLYGMPVIDADRAKTIFILKRSMGTGFSGVDNPLFFADNTRMVFGDAKTTLNGLVAEFKQS
ncbi:hypothetical protein CHS0354_006944 [Potamilus streckersoni]|uniref:proton-translocating NAD(P)(+) transhydrogenase n=1 Tax=Potamilus streckersoni TaxID=2493646 RepID=A0AAE0TFT8_9BIVA|nr:hypothetical protein CHS0354_006944 [Potamilus streckersoni]